MNGKAARKLFEQMQNTHSGWGQKDFERLFLGYGFIKGGKKHDIYSHPKYKELSIAVPRHNKLKEWVAREAVKLIKELLEIMRREAEYGKREENT